MAGHRRSDCDECGAVDRLVLQNVRHRNTFRRFCTACVLRSFPGSFCPVCFRVFETLPPPTERAMCLTCPSVSHLSCTMSGDHAMRYECRHCHNRNPSLFELKFDGRRKGGRGEEIDLDSAGKLFAAAWIASASLNKAAVAARAEAERRAGEVVVARKKAKEALERLASLTSREAGENDQNGSGLMRNGQTSGAGAEDILQGS
uniref:Uncharacterized protein n=1 Tax=Kalanchoe fedtschenkoi TaxID=63787 RepID=A0A7N1A2S1_KALFE